MIISRNIIIYFVSTGGPKPQVCKSSHWQQATIEITFKFFSVIDWFF